MKQFTQYQVKQIVFYNQVIALLKCSNTFPLFPKRLNFCGILLLNYSLSSVYLNDNARVLIFTQCKSVYHNRNNISIGWIAMSVLNVLAQSPYFFSLNV